MIPISVQSEFRPMTWAMSALNLKVCQQASVRQNFLCVQRDNLQAQLREGLRSNSASFPRVCRDLSPLSCVQGPAVCTGVGVQPRNTLSTILEGAVCIRDWHRQQSLGGRDANAKTGLQDLKGSCGYSPPCLTGSKTIKSKEKKNPILIRVCRLGPPENWNNLLHCG